MMRTRLLSLTLVIMLSSVSSGQQRTSSPGEEIHAQNCFVQYINKITVPAKAEGTLLELKFEEGATVNRDDVLAVIDDTAALLALKLKQAEAQEAILKAENDVNLRDAVNAEELARDEAVAYIDLYKDRAIPLWEMEKKRLEAKRAKLRIELAEMQKQIDIALRGAKSSEVKIAEFELTRRSVTAPSTGFIQDRIAQLGEWVQPGSPICTLIQMDRLRVEGDIDATQYPGYILQGAPVTVLVYRLGVRDDSKAEKIPGKLGFVSMELDINKRYRVWVEIENKRLPNGDWLYKPGMPADIIIRKPASAE